MNRRKRKGQKEKKKGNSDSLCDVSASFFVSSFGRFVV